MESFLERTKDADLEQLRRELSSRRRPGVRRSLRLKVWRFTVRSSYALKRLIDVFFSLAGMIVLSPLFAGIAVG